MNGLLTRLILLICLAAGAQALADPVIATNISNSHLRKSINDLQEDVLNELSHKHGCAGCHDATKKKMGPTWSEIAEKREGDRRAIINAIQHGSKGAYGKIPMPPQPKALHNAEALADLILSINKKSTHSLDAVTIRDAQDRIRLKIRGLLRIPEGVKGNPEVVYRVRLFPNGEIMGAPERIQSSGQPAYDSAVESAILKASPLPLPTDAGVAADFRTGLELRFRPFEEKPTVSAGGFAYRTRKLGETCNASKDCDGAECIEGHCRSVTAEKTEKPAKFLADLALHYYIQAAQQGDLDAQKRLSIMYRDGIGVTVDKQMADIWERIASQNQLSSKTGQSDHALTSTETMPVSHPALHTLATNIMTIPVSHPAVSDGNHPKTAKDAPRFPRLIKGIPMFNPVWVPPGSLILRVHVLANGEPDQVLVKESSGSNILDDEAVSQIRAARFQPGERDGRVTDYWVDLPITYKKPSYFGFGGGDSTTNPIASTGGEPLAQTRSAAEIAAPPIPAYIPPADTTPPTFAFPQGMHITLTDGPFTLRGHAQDPSGITEIRVNGQPIVFGPDGAFSHKRFFRIGETQLVFVATDSHGNTAKATVAVLRQTTETQAVAANEPELIPPEAKAKANPNALALIVGIEEYGHTFKAQHAARDAQLFYDYAQRSLGIPAENIKLLIGEKATRADLLHAVKNWLGPRVSPGKSQVVVFFAGHGLASSNGERAFLIPQDARPDLLEDTALDRQRLMADIAQAQPQSALFFFDTCYSGGARGGDKTLVAGARPIIIKPRADLLPPGFMQFSAASNDQLAHSHPSQPHGLFSYYLMRGLSGEADANHDNRLTAGELQSFVQERVQRLAQTKGRPQVPELIGDPERVIAVWKR